MKGVKLVIANWKMNPATARDAVRLARAVSRPKRRRGTRVILCAPFVFLSDLRRLVPGVRLGAQDCFWKTPAGPYTGEISPAMLKNIGITHVIVGHSERRALGETDEAVAKKAAAAVEAGLTVVMCVGEPWGVRKKGHSAVRAFVRRQLAASLENVPRTANRLAAVYEPVWAISTSAIHRACDPDEAERMVRFVVHAASRLGFRGVRGVYGGSVDDKNARAYLSRVPIDGVLPGAASLDPRKFRRIVGAAEAGM